MDISKGKEYYCELKNVSSLNNCIEDKVCKKVNHNILPTKKSQISIEGDGFASCVKTKIYLDNSDIESAYEESCCSNSSEEKLALKNETCSSPIDEIPLFRFKNSKNIKKNKQSININKRITSTSKVCDEPPLILEDKVKSLSLNEVRPTKTTQIRCTRKNMSFTNDEILKIERDNEILLRKIMAQQKSPTKKILPVQQKLSSSAVNRKRLQKKIEEDNMILLQRLQRAKSCTFSNSKIPGFRATYF